MKAVNGYLDNGRFTPFDVVTLPHRVRALLVYNDATTNENDAAQTKNKDNNVFWDELKLLAQEAAEEDRERRAVWLDKLHKAVKESLHEEFPDIQRSQTMREPIDLKN